MDAMQSRIKALDFDHELLRSYPGGALIDRDDILSDETRTRAAIRRLDVIEKAPTSLTQSQKEFVQKMLYDCNERLKRRGISKASRKKKI